MCLEFPVHNQWLDENTHMSKGGKNKSLILILN